jgi:hypothetical protein
VSHSAEGITEKPAFRTRVGVAPVGIDELDLLRAAAAIRQRRKTQG